MEKEKEKRMRGRQEKRQHKAGWRWMRKEDTCGRGKGGYGGGEKEEKGGSVKGRRRE